MLPFLALQRQRCTKFRVLRAQDFYTPLALNCQKGQHLPALEVYKSQSPSSFPSRKSAFRFFWKIEDQGAPKGRQQKGETGPGTHIFADFRWFSARSVNQGIWESQISQKTAGNRRFSQETAANRRFLQKPVSPICCFPFVALLEEQRTLTLVAQKWCVVVVGQSHTGRTMSEKKCKDRRESAKAQY